jgi:DNA mismatch repair ATPase MutS
MKKDGIRFQTEKLQSLNEKYVQVREEYESQQKTVVQDVINIAREWLFSE